jgi:hypothetical protein
LNEQCIPCGIGVPLLHGRIHGRIVTQCDSSVNSET